MNDNKKRLQFTTEKNNPISTCSDIRWSVLIKEINCAFVFFFASYLVCRWNLLQQWRIMSVLHVPWFCILVLPIVSVSVKIMKTFVKARVRLVSWYRSSTHGIISVILNDLSMLIKSINRTCKPILGAFMLHFAIFTENYFLNSCLCYKGANILMMFLLNNSFIRLFYTYECCNFS